MVKAFNLPKFDATLCCPWVWPLATRSSMMVGHPLVSYTKKITSSTMLYSRHVLIGDASSKWGGFHIQMQATPKTMV